MKKGIRFAGAASALALLLMLNGCGGGNEAKTSASASGTSATTSTASAGSTAEVAVDVVKVAERLKNEIKYDDKLAEMEEESMDIVYPTLPKDKIKAMKVYLSSSGGTAEEIACFEAVDEEAAKAVEEELKSRIETQTASFRNYVPEELKRLDKAFVVRNGKYAYLSVSNEPDKAKSIIEGN